MITKILRFKYYNALNKHSTNKIPVFTVILLFIISSLSVAYPQSQMIFESPRRAIVWDVSLSFNEPGSAYDYTIFGEAPDANDGPPADSYDTVKPPAPMPSYIRAWFNDNLPFPYNNLWKDYRHYPEMNKVWNLSVQWVPEDSESPTTITISWNPSEINTSDYTSILLCTSGGTPLRNMLMYSSYFFVCPAFLPQTFKIMCTANQAPGVPSNPSPSNGSTGVPINADLGWTCSDPNGDALRYDVYFGSINPPPKVVSNSTVPTYDPGPMSPGILYYWKIVARDIYDASTTGPIWHFQTNSLPNQPSNPNPSNGSTNVPINVNLSWTGGDPDLGDTVTYDVYFGTSSSPPIKVHNQSALTYDPGTLNSYTQYYWKIVAWDNHGASSSGSLWQFRTVYINNPPYAPSTPSPADGSTQIPVNSGLSWTGGDPDSGDFVTYDVYFGCTIPLTKIKSNTSGTSCALENLNYGMKYYWKIIAWDNHYHSTSGPLWSFTTKTDTSPPSLAISQPKKGYLYVYLLGGRIQRITPIFVTTLVIGQIEVIATASDSQSGVNRVEFYLDDELKKNDTSEPYSWSWVERGNIFPYLLKVIAYDNCGNPSTWSLRVWKVL